MGRNAAAGSASTGHCYGQPLDNVLLAGRAAADNCVEAAQVGNAGLDFENSGVSHSRIKDARLHNLSFQTLRAY